MPIKARALCPRRDCFGDCVFIRKACGFKLDLVFRAVDCDVTVDVVGDAIFVPFLPGVFGDPLFERLALVLAACEDFLSGADVGGSHVQQAVAGDGGHPDTELFRTTVGSAFPVHCHQPLRKVGKVDRVNRVVQDKPKDVGGRGGGGIVGVQQVHHCQHLSLIS